MRTVSRTFVLAFTAAAFSGCIGQPPPIWVNIHFTFEDFTAEVEPTDNDSVKRVTFAARLVSELEVDVLDVPVRFNLSDWHPGRRSLLVSSNWTDLIGVVPAQSSINLTGSVDVWQDCSGKTGGPYCYHCKCYFSISAHGGRLENGGGVIWRNSTGGRNLVIPWDQLL